MSPDTPVPIRPFFDAYAAAFDNGDTTAIAAAYADTFLTSSAQGARANHNDAHFHALLEQEIAFYRRIGMDSVRIVSYADQPLDPHHTLVKIQWTFLRADGSTLVTFDLSYLMHRGAGGPKIILLIPHNKTEKMRERGLLPS